MCALLLQVCVSFMFHPISAVVLLFLNHTHHGGVLGSFLCLLRLDWPVRTLSFSHDGRMLASASEDHFIDIAEVETGQWATSGLGY